MIVSLKELIGGCEGPNEKLSHKIVEMVVNKGGFRDVSKSVNMLLDEASFKNLMYSSSVAF